MVFFFSTTPCTKLSSFCRFCFAYDELHTQILLKRLRAEADYLTIASYKTMILDPAVVVGTVDMWKSSLTSFGLNRSTQQRPVNQFPKTSRELLKPTVEAGPEKNSQLIHERLCGFVCFRVNSKGNKFVTHQKSWRTLWKRFTSAGSRKVP
jgi:hypothetical protein